MAMDSAIASLPHAMTVAHRELQDSLDKGIAQFKEYLTFSNGRDICSAVERFVGELCREPVWRVELERRAGLVESSCGRDSDFRRAMGAAWKAYRAKRRKALGPGPSGTKLALQALRKAEYPPISLTQVLKVRYQLERIVKSDFLGHRVRAVFHKWKDVCVAIQREAKRLEVDGCHYLYHIYQAANSSASEWSRCARQLVEEGPLGGGWLKHIHAAADSLLHWAAEHLPPTSDAAKTPGDLVLAKPGNNGASAEAQESDDSAFVPTNTLTQEGHPVAAEAPGAKMSPRELADKHGVKREALGKRLKRWRYEHDAGYVEVSNPARNEPK